MAYEQAGYTAESPEAPTHLIAGGTYTTRKVTILSGTVLAAGAVLGMITASEKYVLADDGNADGSEVPEFPLLHDVDASDGDVEALVIETCSGGVAGSALTLGGSLTIDDFRDAWTAKGLPIDV